MQLYDVPMNIPIAEVFGPTVQGEGALAGKPTYFVRVGGCDFKCVWCDSKQAVLPEHVRDLPRMSQDEIIEAVVRLQPGPVWLTLSGGNPALYDFSGLIPAWKYDALAGMGKVAVETQGTIWKDWLAAVDVLTVSPKPPSSEMKNGLDFIRFMQLAEEFKAKPVLKVVVFDNVDYEFAARVHRNYPKVPFYLSCGTASGGLSGKWSPTPVADSLMGRPWIDDEHELLDRYKWLCERAMTDARMADVAILPQLHALAWGITTRGV